LKSALNFAVFDTLVEVFQTKFFKPATLKPNVARTAQSIGKNVFFYKRELDLYLTPLTSQHYQVVKIQVDEI
jgi:hypothetical protein